MTLPITISLLRHGEVKGGSKYRGQTDDPLTELGYQQMKEAFSFINLPINHIYTSPLNRCKKFAQKVANKENILLSNIPDLQEIYFGDWEGKDYDKVYHDNPHLVENYYNNPYQYTPPNGETFDRFEQRVTKTLKQILIECKKEKHSHVLLITHAGTIRVILKNTLKLSFENCFNFNINYGCLIQLNTNNNHAQLNLLKNICR